MDDRGRVFDNIFVERLWRTVKYEDIYLRDHTSVEAVDAVWRGISASTTKKGRTSRSGYRTPAAIHGVVKR
jgi:putative transposase